MTGAVGPHGLTTTRIHYKTGVLAAATAGSVFGAGKIVDNTANSPTRLKRAVNLAGGDATPNFTSETPIGESEPVQVSEGAGRNPLTFEILLDSASAPDAAFLALAAGADVTMAIAVYTADDMQTAYVYQCRVATNSPVFVAGRLVHHAFSLSVQRYFGSVEAA